MLIGVINMDFSTLKKNYLVPGLENELNNGSSNGMPCSKYIL